MVGLSMNDYTDIGPWVLRWDHHPTKKVLFEKDFSGGKPFIKISGTGFQGLDDPPPRLFIPHTSLGDWSIDLNNDDSCYLIGIEFAREVWHRMLGMGWIQIDYTSPI